MNWTHEQCQVLTEFIIDQARNFEYAFFTKRIKRNQIVYLMGDPAGELFLIQKGRVRVSVISLDGKEKTVEMIRAGGFFGELCLCPNGRRHDQAIAFEESNLASIKARMFFELLNSKPEVVGYFLKFFCNRMIATQEQLTELASTQESSPLCQTSTEAEQEKRKWQEHFHVITGGTGANAFHRSAQCFSADWAV